MAFGLERMGSSTIKSASHRVTNDVIFDLLSTRLNARSRVLDFGAGAGHMSQRVGERLRELGGDPARQLVPCEIVPEAFQYAEVPCVRIGVDSVIPSADRTLDLIYSIEVLEHTFRPYDFMSEAWRALRPGGWLVFSVPNSLHMKSRWMFLLTGFPELFGPPSTAEKNAGRICGHIMPLNYSYFVYGLRRLGFEGVTFYPDRLKRSSWAMSALLYPVLKCASLWFDRQLRSYDEEVWRENRAVVWRMNSMEVLSSRSCIVVAQKPEIG